ncbi:MAG: DMT family transporter [Holosporales bacterium]
MRTSWLNRETTHAAPRHTAAVLFMMLSVGLYAVQDVIVKSLPTELHVVQISFFRSFFAFIPIFVIGYYERRQRIFKSQWPIGHLVRATLSFLALLCFIHAFRTMPLANAYTFTFTAPLFLTLFSAPLLREKVSPARWGAVVVGFSGILIMLRPSGGLSMDSLIALGGGVFYGLSLVYVRSLSSTDSNTLIVLTFTLLSTFLSGLALPWFWQPMTLTTLALFACVGTLGGLAQYAMTQAMRLAPVSSIAPFDYAALLWAVLFDWIFFTTKPDVWMLLGGSIIIGAGLFLAKREKTAL